MTVTIEILHLTVDEDGDDSHYRVLVGGQQFKYLMIDAGVYQVADMVFPPFLLPKLPPFPSGDWNLGQISRSPETGQPEFAWTEYKAFSGVTHLWHPVRVDYLSLRLGKMLMSNVYEVETDQFSGSVIAKFARFPYETIDMDEETQAYEWIEGRGIGPRFLGHLTEEGRVTGFLLEKVEGQHATVEDLPACKAIVSRLHDLGIIHNDLNKHNFLVKDERAVLVDFQCARKSDDPAEMRRELSGLEEQLRSDSRKGGMYVVDPPSEALAVEEGQHYEAHQQLRTIAARYVKQGNYDAAIDILHSGAQSLLKAGQGGSGGDLCLFLVEVYNTAELKPDSSNKGPLERGPWLVYVLMGGLPGKIISLMRLFSSEEPSRKRFITEALTKAEHDAYDAERHLTLGTKDSVDHFVKIEYDWYAEDESHTAPLYAARAVLPYLLVGNVRNASASYERFASRLHEEHPNLATEVVCESASKMKVYPSLPLLNFLGLLLSTIQQGGADLFRQLQAHYAAHIKEIGMWDDALEQVGEMYFGIERRRQTNPLFDMMGSLFGGGGAPNAPQPRSRRVEAPTPAPDLD
ncbi:MAG: hypothetical protein M1817_006577 [Caeruleum heppii]|nr:MAG: hypothetical protein M1817_006577 [Caeruleum heppii]